MKAKESEGILLKRRGAAHVAKLLAGMNKEEQLEFWEKRTKLLMAKNKSLKQTDKLVLRPQVICR